MINLTVRYAGGISLESSVEDILVKLDRNEQAVIEGENLPKVIRKNRPGHVVYIEGKIIAVSSIPYLESKDKRMKVSELVNDEKEGFYTFPQSLSLEAM